MNDSLLESRDDSSDHQSEEQRRSEAPSYDTSMENYAGIASGDLEADAGLKAEKDFAQMVVDTVREGLLVLGLDLCVKAANESFYKIFQVRPEETVGHLVYELGDGQWDLPELRELLQEILPEKKTMSGFEVSHDFKNLGQRVMQLNARQLDDHQMILLAIEDLTDQRNLQNHTAELEARVEMRTRQLRKLASTLTMAEQGERRRISQILHDDLQQLLYGIGVKMTFIRGHAEASRNQQLLEDIGEVEKWLSQGVEITRNLTVDLSPPILKDEGLTDALQWLRSRMEDLYGLDVIIEADHAFWTPEEDMRVLLFQIVRELLFNIVKHAGASQATIKLKDEGHHIKIVVIDNGKGFDVEATTAQAAPDEHFGLFSVRERLGLFGGTMQIDSTPGEGTRVTISVPLQLG